MHDSWLLDILRVNLWQHDESTAVVGPRNQMRQLTDRRLIGEHWAAANVSRQHRKGGEWRFKISARPTPKTAGVHFQFNQPPDRIQRVAEQETSTLDTPEQIRQHRKATILDARKQHRWSTRPVDAPVNFSSFQAWIDFVFQPHELASPFQIGDTMLQAAVRHKADNHSGFPTTTDRFPNDKIPFPK